MPETSVYEVLPRVGEPLTLISASAGDAASDGPSARGCPAQADGAMTSNINRRAPAGAKARLLTRRC